MVKIYIFVPDEQDIINALIEAATQAGAGKLGNYSRCAFMQKGIGTWKSEPGAKPAIGSIGGISHINEVKIEMICEDRCLLDVINAIKKTHPYEQPAIDILRLETV